MSWRDRFRMLALAMPDLVPLAAFCIALVLGAFFVGAVAGFSLDLLWKGFSKALLAG